MRLRRLKCEHVFTKRSNCEDVARIVNISGNITEVRGRPEQEEK